MSEAAKQNDLIYVSSDDSSQVGFADVYVFTFPKGQLVGRLTGFTSPSGMCTGTNGDIFVPDYAQAVIYQYHHGEARPTNVFSDSGAFPIACSINAETGDLIVSNGFGPGNTGSLAIYRGARGPAQIVSDYQFFEFFGVSYDSEGNAFVATYDNNLQLAFVELKKGSSSLREVSMPRLHGANGLVDVSWDGTYVALGNVSTNNVVYRMRIKNYAAHVEGKTLLRGAKRLEQFLVTEVDPKDRRPYKVLVGPNYDGVDVDFWAYPAGGDPVKSLRGIAQPAGTALSRASK